MERKDIEQCECGSEHSPAEEDKEKLGNEILEMLSKRTANPSEAFVMMQQMCIMLWAQYKIDWKNSSDRQLSESKKQRYLDFVSSLIDNLEAAAPSE